MPNYLRNRVYGGTYFFTLVTHNRKPYFSNQDAIEILMEAVRQTQERKPFELIAYCVLFDHLHLIISLPVNDRYFSERIRNIKRITTKELRELYGMPKLNVWQERFWEHTIRDEEDLKHHFDYIHYNPVKHGYVEDTGDWAWSSYPNYFSNDPSIQEIIPSDFEINNRSYGE